MSVMGSVPSLMHLIVNIFSKCIETFKKHLNKFSGPTDLPFILNL